LLCSSAWQACINTIFCEYNENIFIHIYRQRLSRVSLCLVFLIEAFASNCTVSAENYLPETEQSILIQIPSKSFRAASSARMVGVTESTLLDHTPPPASPHCQKRTSTSTLLGIDADSRATILDHLLLNRTQKTADAERKKLGEIELDGEEQDIVFTYTPFFNAEVAALLGLMDSKKPGYRTIFSIANVQILQVCRQLFHEGKTILYGKNRFVLQSYRHPSPVIPKFVGSSNLASIKMLRMELPLEVKLDLRTGLPNYLGILKKRLPGLCELKLTTTFHPCDHVWSEDLEHRAILYSAACSLITMRT
jgi:hypothetical protein